MTHLDPSQVSAIIGVRELLVEASRRVSDRSVGGRHAAVVLLDGAVEAAVSVCLGQFGDSAGERDTLADMHRRLMTHLGAKSRCLPGWRDASRLRRARNLAQHHQIPVDSDALGALYPPVSAYVEEAIRATLGVRLVDVVLSDAITDDELRRALAEAETALDSGEPGTGLRLVSATFRTARERWVSSTRGQPGGVPPLGRDEFGIAESIDKRTADLRDLVEVSSFAADPAEYLWYRRVISPLRIGHGSAATEDDVRRALQFVVGWIVRWEAYDRAHREISERERERRRFKAPWSSREGGRPEWIRRPEVVAKPNRVEIRGPVAWGKADETMSAHRTGVSRWDVLCAGSSMSMGCTSTSPETRFRLAGYHSATVRWRTRRSSSSG